MDKGMVREIMNIDVDSLIEKQHLTLKSYVINVLENVIEMVKDEKYEELNNMLCNSPSGDSKGEDNKFINFSYRDNCEEDLSEILYELIEFKMYNE